MPKRELNDTRDTVSDARTSEAGSAAVEGALLGGAQPGDFEPAVPTGYRKLRNSTWRILEEQRMHAIEIAQECDGAIKLLETKRDDALAAAAACVAVQQSLEQA